MQLFFIDDAGPSQAIGGSDVEDNDLDSNASPFSKPSSSKHTKPSDSLPTTEPKSQPKTLQKSSKRSAWTDPDDSPLTVSLSSKKQLRKLRDTPSEDVVSGVEYEAKLRRQFEKIHGTVEWAQKARDKIKSSNTKRKRESQGQATDADEAGEPELALEGQGESGLSDLLRSTTGILSSSEKRSQKVLERGTINIERLRDANQAAQAEDEIKALGFHPSPSVPLLFTASADRRLRLFNVSPLS